MALAAVVGQVHIVLAVTASGFECVEDLPTGNALSVKRCAAAAGHYFSGSLRCFDLPLALEGTPFQRQVWRQLLSVGYGETPSYGAIAVAVDNPKAVRAVDAANGRNPVAILVPCHRVIGSGSLRSGALPKLTRYGGGPWG